MAKPRTPKKTTGTAKKPVKDAVVADPKPGDPVAVKATPKAPVGAKVKAKDPADEPVKDPKADEVTDSLATGPDTKPADTAAPQKRTSRVMPMVLGGAIAAAIGFAGGTYLNLYGSQSTGTLTTALAQRDARIQDLTSQLKTLDAQVSTLSSDLGNSAFVSEPALKTQIAQLRAEIDTSLEGLITRVAALEKQLQSGVAGDAAALSAYQGELATLKGALSAQAARNDALAAEVQALSGKAEAVAAQASTDAKATLVQAAVLRIEAALDSGAPFAEALADIRANTDVSVPPVLAQLAGSGVPTMTTLRADFPAAARQALAASRTAEPATGTMGKLENFVMGQLGVRSLEPKDGTGPDAVLSRAEAALNTGDLAKAQTELANLPAAGQEKMAPWLAKARTRMNAVTAAETLSQGIK